MDAIIKTSYWWEVTDYHFEYRGETKYLVAKFAHPIDRKMLEDDSEFPYKVYKGASWNNNNVEQLIELPEWMP